MIDWLRARRWTVGLIVVNLPWVVGFAAMERLNDKTETVALQAQDAADEAHDAARHARAQARQNKQVIGCLTDYAVTATLALGSQGEWVRTFRTLVAKPPAGGPDVARERFLDATAEHLRTLRKVRDVELGLCLREIEDAEIREAAFELVAATTSLRFAKRCFGRRVTIRGTPNDDVLHGTGRRDVIASFGGTDLIVAGDGKDRVCSGKGGDVVNAGRGYDRVNCGKGRDSAQQAERKRSC